MPYGKVIGKKRDNLKTHLKIRLTSPWGSIFLTLAVFFLSAYLPPPLKLALWVFCLYSIIAPIVRGIIGGMKNRN